MLVENEKISNEDKNRREDKRLRRRSFPSGEMNVLE